MTKVDIELKEEIKPPTVGDLYISQEANFVISLVDISATGPAKYSFMTTFGTSHTGKRYSSKEFDTLQEAHDYVTINSTGFKFRPFVGKLIISSNL
jgi:hypothetical protein